MFLISESELLNAKLILWVVVGKWKIFQVVSLGCAPTVSTKWLRELLFPWSFQTKHSDSHIQLLPNSLFLNFMETPQEKAIAAGPVVGQEDGGGPGDHLPSVLVACHQHVGGAALEVDT